MLLALDYHSYHDGLHLESTRCPRVGTPRNYPGYSLPTSIDFHAHFDDPRVICDKNVIYLL